MEITKESYILSRNIVRVDNKKNKFLNFIRIHKAIIIATVALFSLIIAEVVLLNQFINLLKVI